MSNEAQREQTSCTRRSFLRTGAVAIASLSVADTLVASGKIESLAVSGGPKAVQFPSDQHAALCRWPRYGAAEKKRLHELIESNQLYEELPLFEKEWKDYHHVPYVKAHCNGTSALTSMFFALDLPPGSEIMVPSYTFFATILPMRFFQYVPIFIDISPRTACFDLDHAARELTPRTRALLPMHSWGLPCDMDQIEAFAKEHGLIVLEDAAHAHGASLQGRKTGTWGAMSIFSFQTSKPLPAIEGGMGLYQTREYYERAAAFGHYEDPPKFPEDSPYRVYHGTGFGQKYRMHPFAAALARQQLAVLDERNAAVAARVRQLNDRLVQLPGLSAPFCRADARRVYYSVNMLFLDEAKAGFSRAALVKALQAEGVRASAGDYPEQHKFRIYSEAKWWHHPPKVPAVLPGCAQVNRSCIYLPLFYEDAPNLIEQYAQAFEKVWAHRTTLAKV